MALPTKSDISSNKFSFNGSPFVKITQSSSIDTNSMKYSFDGSNWWGVQEIASASYTMKERNGLARASIKEINGLAIASLKERNGLT